MDAVELHRKASVGFGEQVHAVGDDQWDLPTPCADWSVRELVQHVVGEDRWTAPLFAGRTIADVGDELDGDLLGADPVASWDAALKEALEAAAANGAMERTVHLSFGDFPGSAYAMQLFADHLIHGWDLATAIGGDTKLDPELVQACQAWFESVEQAYREMGAIGARPPVPADANPQTQLLAAFGRTG